MKGGLFATGAWALVMTSGLSACAGGGGVTSTSTTPVTTTAPVTSTTQTPTTTATPAVNYDTAEYENSTYAVDANAITAYNVGATGQGVKIGIVDSGLNPNLSEFTGRIDPASGDVAGARGVGDDSGHGTAVTAVAAAARDGQNTMGVAFNATIVSERADQPGSCSQSAGCQFYDAAVASGIDAARTAGAKVINLSLGGTAPGGAVTSAMQRAVNAGIVLVISAGNDGAANPNAYALVPAQQFAGSVIIAGSVGVASSSGVDINTISTFSNQAGTGAAYYLAAVGYQDRAPDQTGAQFYWSGTSFSAPTIAGAVALMAQAFPNLTGKQIVSILFQTADDLGATGVDSVYGNGRLDLQRAFAPIGTTSLAGSQTAISSSVLPSAAGDAAATSPSLSAVVLDSYKRAYVVDLATTLRRADTGHPLSQALAGDMRVGGSDVGPLSVAMTVSERHDLASGYSVDAVRVGPEDLRQSRLMAGSAVARLDNSTAVAFGFARGAKEMERRLTGASAGSFLIAGDIASTPGFVAKRNSSVAVRRELGGIGFSMSGETGDALQDISTSAIGAPYRLASASLDATVARTRLSIGMSRLDEKDSLLGGRMSPLMGGGGASTEFVDAEARHNFGGGWTSTLGARHGWTKFAGGAFGTDAYSFDVVKAGLFSHADSIGFRVAQPLRIDHGGLAISLPTVWDYETETATDTLTRMSMSPSGREIDGELSYGSSLIEGRGWFGGNLFYRRDPGHIASARDDTGAALRFSLTF